MGMSNDFVTVTNIVTKVNPNTFVPYLKMEIELHPYEMAGDYTAAQLEQFKAGAIKAIGETILHKVQRYNLMLDEPSPYSRQQREAGIE
jgi:hypothetical protein